MKATIKASLLAVALLVGISINAQVGPISFGVKAGMNLSNMHESDGGGNGDAKVGFNAGVTLDYAFASDVYLMTGLEYSLKGTKQDNLKLNLSYLQLPVHVGYKLTVAPGTKIVFHVGPYIGYAVDGKWKIGGISVDAFGDEMKAQGASLLKRFDFGVGLGAGVEFGKIGIGLGYDFGLANTAKSFEYEGEKYDSKLRNMNAYLTLGYKF